MQDPTPETRNTMLRNGLPHFALNLAGATYIMALLNTAFWQRLMTLFEGDLLAAIGLAAAVGALTLLLLELIGPSVLQKPFLAVLILISTSANYFQTTFGVFIDEEMVRSTLETTVAESRHLITASMVLEIGLRGVLPVLVLWKIPVRRARVIHQLWRYPLGVVVSFALVIGFLFTNYKTYSSVLRENHALMESYQPGATLLSVAKFIKHEYATGRIEVAPLGEDVAQGAQLSNSDKPLVFVLFVGETTRATDFGLEGYARNTTPNLAAREDVIYFPNTTSCGTVTTVSVPCMFSPFSQDDYSRDRYFASENLVDVISRAGFDVQWWDNNTGDQTVMQRLDWAKVDATWDPDACAAGECTDAIFLPLIDQVLETATGNTLLILHMIGSHGPAYFMRYPESRAQFTPDCRSAEFADCTDQAIINAYDNTIIEADYVLARAIERLSQAQNVDTAMLYISDHGESLGEGGVFLHGLPRFMAPDVQTHVPFLVWLGQSYQSRFGIDQTCLESNRNSGTSQDMVFHSMLGLLNLDTEARDPRLDITTACSADAG